MAEGGGGPAHQGQMCAEFGVLGSVLCSGPSASTAGAFPWQAPVPLALGELLDQRDSDPSFNVWLGSRCMKSFHV